VNNERVSKNRLVGVYKPSTPSYCRPDSNTDIDDARRLVTNGEADSINRGKAIRLRTSSKATTEELPARPGESRKPNPALMQRALDGSLSASIACSSWAGRVVDAQRLREGAGTMRSQ
jgi:hypothetical protein